ncbi:hypothetical protein NEOLEDRAFT_937777 [Neolentinus lepideus HHB14362 ss-1]|uniref:Fungal-type protein kinase domain-containing protein n=1 Tax=Neolentinus lepideus HHB14362 ss-1 TaxID=1314782 RepID=A0A165NHB3_9AGAM|nr:hypothetical protein NEOLEDRAFT_937777 [Neolentinus lepideus HHB14362 ss-1]
MEIVETQMVQLSMSGSFLKGDGSEMDMAAKEDLQVDKIKEDSSQTHCHRLVGKPPSLREAAQTVSDMLRAHRDAGGPVESMERTGIWQFMSQEVLRDPARRRSVYHDFEMAFWVLVWLGMRHFPNSSCTRARTLDGAFREREWDKDARCYRGGTMKEAMLLSRISVRGDELTTAPVLNDLVELLRHLLCTWTLYGHESDEEESDTCEWRREWRRRRRLERPEYKEFRTMFELLLRSDRWDRRWDQEHGGE